MFYVIYKQLKYKVLAVHKRETCAQTYFLIVIDDKFEWVNMEDCKFLNAYKQFLVDENLGDFED